GSQLVEGDVAAGEDDRHARAGRQLDQSVQQRRDRGGGGAFDDEFATLHDPDHGVEDFAVGEGHDFVDEALYDGKVDLAGAADAQAVDDRFAVDRFEVTGFDALLHRRAIARFDADDADVRVVTLHGHRDAGDQSAAADRDDDRVELGPVLNDFQSERSLAGDELLVVERMNVRESFVAHQLFRFLVRLISDRLMQHALCVVAA